MAKSTTKRARRPRDPSALKPIAAVRAKIREVRDDRDLAKAADGWTAVSTLHRLEISLLEDLRELQAAADASSSSKPLDAKAAFAELVALVPLLPDDLLASLAGAIDERLGT